MNIIEIVLHVYQEDHVHLFLQWNIFLGVHDLGHENNNKDP